MSPLARIVDIVASARSARRSVKANLVVSAICLGIGVGLATNWYYPVAILVVGGLGMASCILSTFNGPYPWISRVSEIAGALVARIRRLTRPGRPATP